MKKIVKEKNIESGTRIFMLARERERVTGYDFAWVKGEKRQPGTFLPKKKETGVSLMRFRHQRVVVKKPKPFSGWEES